MIASRRMAVVLLLGFSCGLPLLLTASVLQAWLKREGVSLEAIGLMALVGLPYTLKFLWAPLLDRFTIPGLGRRRGWLLAAQLALALSIVSLGLTDPVAAPWLVAFVAMLVTFFSATQDVVVDAHRRETLAENELGLGSSLYVYGYRTGMLLASGGGLILADHLPFPTVYGILALAMVIGVVTTLLADEPVIHGAPPASLAAAVAGPFRDYFARRVAWPVLLFILLYKL
ncbi:MAG: MFS transporter, partial [Candidatus Binatia bacterium]